MLNGNRPLRRKPPPPLDQVPAAGPTFENNTDTEEPIFDLRTPEKSNNFPFQTPYNLEKRPARIPLTVNPDLSYESMNPGFDGYVDFALYADYAEDLLLSYESPRPKGPQDLPFDVLMILQEPFLRADLDAPDDSRVYNDASVDAGMPNYGSFGAKSESVSRGPGLSLLPKHNPYRQRRFQNLLQGGPLPFLQVESSSEDEAFEPGEAKNLGGSEETGRASGNPAQLPYPLSDTYSSDEDIGRFNNLTSKTQSTPSRIPTLSLAANPFLQAKQVVEDTLRSEAEAGENARDGSPDFHFLRNSPPRLLALPSTSPDLSPRHYLSSPPTSPTRGSLYAGYDRLGRGTDSRSSRLPSPKKSVGNLPSANIAGFAASDWDSGAFEDYCLQERAPRWSLIENEEDSLGYFDDSFIIPPAANQYDQFDYTILPELPSTEMSHLHADHLDASSDQDESTAATVNGDIGGIRQKLTIRRKNDSLPPVPLDLPLLPFLPNALSALHFAQCASVWSLGDIFRWCLQLNQWNHGQKLTLKEFRKVLMRLIAFHKQDIPIDIISRNVSQIIDLFTKGNLIFLDAVPDLDEKQRLSTQFCFNEHGTTNGVLVDLTSCYCNDEIHKLHGTRDSPIKCYSSQCMINQVIEHEALMRTTNIHELVLGSDWASHWKLAAQDMAIDLTESKRQSLLFDLIKFEQTFIQRAECFVDIAAPEFIKLAKLMVGTNALASMKELENKILSSARELLLIHRELLYEPLMKILVTDGKFIKDLNAIADLYKTWAKAAKSPLLAYISVMPMIEDLLSNNALKKWDELIRVNPRMKELQVNGNLLLMSTFNSRYQQLPLQLMDVRKFFDEEDEEFTSLTKAVEEIRLLGNKVNEMKVSSDNVHALTLVERQLTWKANVLQPRLNLRSSRRKFFFRGDLTRKGDLKINSHSVHVIVLDNYLLITDRQRTQRANTYRVTETPIPIDYLIFEKRDRDPHSASHVHLPTQALSTNGSGLEEEATSFPFKIRYAGRGKGESHTLVAASENDRRKWLSILMQAKANLLKRVSLITPYGFELIENEFFAYEPSLRMTKLPVLCATDPLSVLAKATTLVSHAHKKSLVQRQLSCSFMFTYKSEDFIFLGTDAGVYCSDRRNIWKKIVNVNLATKVTVIPELSVVLVLANKILRYYPLHVLIGIYYERKERIKSYQLSDEAIAFYEFGRHRGLPTLFVAKKKSTGLTAFKVFILETDNLGIFNAFTVTKRFMILAECYGISVFNSSVAVHTQRGFEVLDLQKLSPRTIPEIPASDSSAKKLDGYSRKKVVQSTDVVRKLVSHATPMGMFKLLNNREFLMVYNECAVFVNKSGKLLRTSVIRFSFRPKSISFTESHLFLVCEEVIEVWSISSETNGTNKLIQVIPSKGMQLLDAQTLCFKLAHPTNSDSQLVFRMMPKPENF